MLRAHIENIMFTEKAIYFKNIAVCQSMLISAFDMLDYSSNEKLNIGFISGYYADEYFCQKRNAVEFLTANGFIFISDFAIYYLLIFPRFFLRKDYSYVENNNKK